MGFEDTVIGEEKVFAIIKKLAPTDYCQLSVNVGIKVSKVQAEITWPIAKQIGFEVGLEQGKAEGIKEVVEELTFYNEGITLAQLGATNRWQAFLKERGIE